MWRIAEASRRQAGDTIVEVLIAIAIVSLVLTAAFVMTDKNTRRTITMQEQGQAQKLVEQQIELLHDVADTTGITGKCLKLSTTIEKKSGADCVVDASGNTLTAGYSGPEYTLSITDEGTGKFKTSAKWQTVGGEDSQITMFYSR